MARVVKPKYFRRTDRYGVLKRVLNPFLTTFMIPKMHLPHFLPVLLKRVRFQERQVKLREVKLKQVK